MFSIKTLIDQIFCLIKKALKISLIFILIVFLLVSLSYQKDACKNILWLMGLSWYPQNYNRINQIKFSILTAKIFAPSLQPLIMYGSPPDAGDNNNQFLKWLKKNDVIVCKLKDTQLQHELRSSKKLQDHNRAIYFRMDVDEYMQQCVDIKANIDRNFAIYTDSDVGIVQDINSCTIPKPRIISIGGEFTPNTIVNTGVLIYNISAYSQQKSAFFDFCRKNDWKSITNWDQKLFTDYFGQNNSIDQLPNIYNFKPYWWFLQNETQTPKIIHFHGPKLGSPCIKCMLNTDPNKLQQKCKLCPHAYQRIWLDLQGHTEMYQHYNKVYKKWVFGHPPYFNQKTQKFNFGEVV